MNGPQFYREKIGDQKLQLAARAEFAKVGFDIDAEILKNPDQSERGAKAQRASMRRGLNMLQDQVRTGKALVTNKDGSPNTSIDDAIAWASAVINLISEDLDMPDAARTRRDTSSALRDSEGRKIGVMLTNSVLRDVDQVSSELKAHGDDMSLTDFFRGVAKMKAPDSVRNALSEGTDTAGGYTVPTILLPGILNALVPASSMLNAGASVAILQDQAKSFRIAGIDSIPNAAWRAENGTVAESDPAFRAIDVTPRSLAFRFKVSRELLADSPNLDEALRRAIAGAFAKELDRAGLRGSGTAPEIRGLLNTTNVNAVANGANGAKPTNYSNFVAAWKEITSDNAPAPTAAIMHPREMATFANLADTTGQPLSRPPLLNSMGFFQSSQIPTNLTVGTSTDCSEIYVGDFSQFVFFMREGISIQMVTELYAETGQVGFICHTRVDVAALYAQAFAVITGVRP